MNTEERIKAFAQLGDYIDSDTGELRAAVRQSCVNNPWFTEENTRFALDAISEQYLDRERLNKWTESHMDSAPDEVRDIGLILAGNVPLVGFHDVLTTLISGHRAVIKCSSRDPYLIPLLLDQLTEIEPAFRDRFDIADTLEEFDAVIATGSNATAKHFERYFSDVPSIIRRNRNGVAVLNGSEDDQVLQAYGDDVFRHFGLGCRNVSKVYLPEGFDVKRLINAFEPWQGIVNHDKYMHNFDYNLSTYLINGDPHISTDFIVLLPQSSIISRIGTLHYEYYDDIEALKQHLNEHTDEIQCISTDLPLDDDRSVAPGSTQKPALDDFADGINTLEFLNNL